MASSILKIEHVTCNDIHVAESKNRIMKIDLINIHTCTSKCHVHYSGAFEHEGCLATLVSVECIHGSRTC